MIYITQCKICKKYYADNLIYRKECRVCRFIKNRELKIKDGWSYNEYIILLDNILNDKIKYLNDLIVVMHKELLDIIDVLQHYIIIRHKPLKILLKCDECGKHFDERMNKIHNLNNFCSTECYYKFKKENTLKGEKSPYYNKIKTNCTNCGKEIFVTPYDYNKVNSYGDNHNFCSQQCYWDYRGKYYIGSKCNNYKKEYSIEERNKMRENTLKLYSNKTFVGKITKPHRIINDILTTNNILYENEHTIKYYSMDIYLPEYDKYIEIMGDYFHANPTLNRYNSIQKLNNMHLKNIKQDKSKHTYILKYKNKEILYLWETDILHNIELCKKLIFKYIHNNSIDNYNSFNYKLINNELILNKQIINPYFIENP